MILGVARFALLVIAGGCAIQGRWWLVALYLSPFVLVPLGRRVAELMSGA